jgi:hypothetical protein
MPTEMKGSASATPTEAAEVTRRTQFDAQKAAQSAALQDAVASEGAPQVRDRILECGALRRFLPERMLHRRPSLA